ncbi:acetyltransferase [Knoellia sinensis KCTC 19936]|uniref:Acetyltransferase n=1 Tax=Knoellia sinensis KCTC 19936 TaxID=1385520 RepID=A0A0A0J2U5_9MICO|nr:GNAT family N-acetyltransferase [Knoellia sinensis]KGN31458.1 acetyltransferase [Knoellia sinensis KCTC 19936]
MTTTRGTPTVDELDDVVMTLREWQDNTAPMQLHPGDIGWFWRFGAEATAAAVRTWSRDGDLVAIGLLDGDDLLRLAFHPQAEADMRLAAQVVADIADPSAGVLPDGEVCVETPVGAAVHDLLGERGWAEDEPWTVLRRDLAEPVEAPDLRIEVVGPERADVWAAVQRSAFDNPAAVDERWFAMAAGIAHADARSLVAHDEEDRTVAAVTVWSAGEGRPGIIEPMGVHADHRGRGHGAAICVAAAAALRELGSSSALVATPTSNVGAVATYGAAGFAAIHERWDRVRR